MAKKSARTVPATQTYTDPDATCALVHVSEALVFVPMRHMRETFPTMMNDLRMWPDRGNELLVVKDLK